MLLEAYDALTEVALWLLFIGAALAGFSVAGVGGAIGFLVVAFITSVFLVAPFMMISDIRRTVARIESQKTGGSTSVYGAPSNSTRSFSGSRELEDESFQLYLIEKFNIEKDEILGKYLVGGKPFGELESALKYAADLDKPKQLVPPPDFNLCISEQSVKDRRGRKVVVYEFPDSKFYVPQDGGYVTFDSIGEAEKFLQRARG